MRYSFSGHESFPCKSMWLKKGYDYLINQNKFTDSDAVVKLGVGKNMVQSIRFWLKAFGLLKDDEVTDIARYIFDDKDGKDPYAEDNFTLWILHYLLVMTNISSIYHLLKFRIWNSSRLSILSKCSQSLVILNNLDG